MRRASVRIPGSRADARSRAGDPRAPRGLPPLRRAVRFRGAVSAVPAGPLPHAGSARGPQAPRAARAIRRVRWLTGRGVVAALAVGIATAWGMGWRGVLLLLAFFVSGSLFTRSPEDARGRRNERQVIANGGVAALAALAGSWPAFAGSLAAATADTWATEIGQHSRTLPRLITNGRPVPAGTNGGITLLGTAGGIAGALFVAGLSYLFGQRNTLAIAVAGIAGMVLDSLLGATVQGAVRWFDNDAVNLAATLSGALIAAAESLL